MCIFSLVYIYKYVFLRVSIHPLSTKRAEQDGKKKGKKGEEIQVKWRR